jgi:hypothetical protein
MATSDVRRRLLISSGVLVALGAMSYVRFTRGEAGVPVLAQAAGAPPEKSAVPVLVELFSSEGCSSCPPADAVLQRLDESGTVNGARVVALEFHVDYWDDLGWKDPFSRSEWSTRQQAYTRAKIGGMYTPEMIIDGREAFVGSDGAHARKSLSTAALRPHVAIQQSREGGSIHVRVPRFTDGPATAWLAIAERGHRTEVLHGENAGSTLLHGPVVKSLTKIRGDAAKGIETTFLTSNAADRSLRVVFVQRDDTREIVGAAFL